MARPAAIDYDRLCSSVERSRRILRFQRQNRLDIAREVAGHRFAEGGALHKTKLNLLSLYGNVIGPLLVANNPRYHLSTADLSAAASVRLEQDWLNDYAVHVKLADVGLRAVDDAFYSTGIVKVALATPCDAAVQAWGITAGEPTCKAIDLDDWVYDVGAKEFGEAEYLGHRYRCPVSVARKMYKRKADDLTGEEESQYNRDGDERIGQLFKGTYSAEEFEEHVDLWELYLPRHQLVVTLADLDVMQPNKRTNKPEPLWVQRWVGPPTGPYHFLRFQRVPGTPMGKGPYCDLYELHMDANNVHRKANNTLRRMKEVTVYPRANDTDAKAMQAANDGDLVPVERPDMIKPVVTAGAAIQGLLTAAEVYKGLFSFAGGNLELLGGRGAQSKTATQDKILNANAGGGIEAMHSKVQTFMAGIGESLLWYAHYHPELVMSAEYKPAGSRGTDRKLYPAESGRQPARDFPFNRAKLRVDPYSLRHKSPEERLGFVNAVLAQIVPMMPILAQQGVAIDANKLVTIFAELGDEPALLEMFTARLPPGSAGGGAGGAGSHERTLPGQTERTYTRRNEPQPEGPGQALGEMSPADFGSTPQAGAA